MSDFQLTERSATGDCRANGELGFATALQAHAKLQRLITAGGSVRIDCSGLERIDSAGLAVLLDAVALAPVRVRCFSSVLLVCCSVLLFPLSLGPRMLAR